MGGGEQVVKNARVDGSMKGDDVPPMPGAGVHVADEIGDPVFTRAGTGQLDDPSAVGFRRKELVGVGQG